jgi:energy-coupling factor transporter ATP-binding protein EcfA2
MKLVSLRLKGYKFFRFNHLTDVHIQFKDLIQIILGKNGCGKSKLIKEMSPLPALDKQFDKKGLKEAIIERNGVIYRCVSDFSQTKPHQFWKGDENLNIGGTISVQRELVFRELDYNDELHNLLLDKTSFTKMSPTKRRDFLQKISDCDVDFATDVYKKVMGGLRDAQGTIKNLKVKVSKEIDSLKGVETDVANIERLVSRLQVELTLLMEAKDPRQYKVEEYLQLQLKEQIQQLEDLSVQIIKNITNVQHFSSNNDLTIDNEELNNLSSSVKNQISDRSVKVDSLSLEYDKITKLMGDMYEMGTDNIGELEETIAKEEKLWNNLNVKIKAQQFQFSGNVSSIIAFAPAFSEKLNDALTDLPDNSDKEFSRFNLEQVELDIRNANAHLIKTEHNYERIVDRISHIKNAENSECPKCNYKWIPGVSPRELEGMTDKAGLAKEQVDTLIKEIKNLNIQRDKILDWGTAYRKVQTIFNEYHGTDNLLDWLLEDDRIFHSPSQYTTIVSRWYHELTVYGEFTMVDYRLTIAKETLAKNKDIDMGVGSTKLKDHLEEIEKMIFNFNDELSELKVRNKMLSELMSMLSGLESYTNVHESTMDAISRTLEEITIVTRNNEISKLIKEHQTNLSQANDKLNMIRGYKHRIDAISDSIKSTEDQLIVLKTLGGILSPVDGLIAKSMGNFIERVIEQMNVVVNSIYTYPIEILPCDVDKDGLSYKFPMCVNNLRDDMPDDVSEGSDGQQEVINFAFKLVATMFMGFEEFPIMLDEIGRAQDETHMGNIMTYIKTLAADKSRQVFMISHFASAHSSYNNANFIVLNSSNITAPSNSNEYTQLTYG